MHLLSGVKSVAAAAAAAADGAKSLMGNAKTIGNAVETTKLLQSGVDTVQRASAVGGGVLKVVGVASTVAHITKPLVHDEELEAREARAQAVKRCPDASQADVQLGRLATSLSRKAYLERVTTDALCDIEDAEQVKVVDFQPRLERAAPEGNTSPQWYLAVGRKKTPEGGLEAHTTLFLVYRGTHTSDDMLQDVCLEPTPSPRGDGERVFFHEGCLAGVTNDRKLRAALHSVDPLRAYGVEAETPLVVCGHSLGGMLAATWAMAGMGREYAPWHKGEVHVVAVAAPPTLWTPPDGSGSKLPPAIDPELRVTKYMVVVNEFDLVPRLLGSPKKIYADLFDALKDGVKVPVQYAAAALAGALTGGVGAIVAKVAIDVVAEVHVRSGIEKNAETLASYRHPKDATVLYISNGRVLLVTEPATASAAADAADADADAAVAVDNDDTGADRSAWSDATQIHAPKRWLSGLAWAQYRTPREYHSATQHEHGLGGIWRPKQLRAIAKPVPEGTVRVVCVASARAYNDTRNVRERSDDPKLDAVGICEAQRERRFLAASGLLTDLEEDPTTLVIVSPYRRALQTLLLLVGDSKKLEALTLQGRLLVEPLAGERQSYWGSTKGWERRRLEGGLNPWQDLKDGKWALAGATVLSGRRGWDPLDNLNRGLPTQGEEDGREPPLFQQDTVDFSPLEAYCDDKGAAFAKDGAMDGEWWLHGHAKGYEEHHEWMARSDRLCAWVYEQARAKGAKKVLLVSHKEILVDAFYRSELYGTAPKEGEAERTVVQFRHAEARCFELSQDKAMSFIASPFPTRAEYERYLRGEVPLPAWDGEKALVDRAPTVGIRTHCEVAELLCEAEEDLDGEEDGYVDTVKVSIRPAVDHKGEASVELLILPTGDAKGAAAPIAASLTSSAYNYATGAVGALASTMGGAMIGRYAFGALGRTSGGAVGMAVGREVLGHYGGALGGEAAKRLVGNDTTGFLLATCGVADPRKQLAHYVGKKLGRKAARAAGERLGEKTGERLGEQTGEYVGTKVGATAGAQAYRALA